MPIGIFDSGLGGLSICKEIIDVLPNESIIYLADSINAPYGDKTKEQIINLSIKNTEFLLEMGAKVIVVACNTATTNAISILRDRFNVPFIGIEPATKPAALQTKSGVIGVLATKGTLKSELFLSTSDQFREELKIIETEGENLVRLIENGQLEDTKPLLEKYLTPMIDAGADNIVLGCTHYPFLIPIINEIIPSGITITDSGEAVAKQTKNILEENSLTDSNQNSKLKIVYTNNKLEIAEEFVNRTNLSVSKVLFKEF